jgi:histidinol-phosphatase (PHP family)
MFDYHIHSFYSGDIPEGMGSTVAELCETAIFRGFTEIAITDHFDVDGIYYGAFPKLDLEGVYRDVFEAKDRYADKLSVLFGLEIGQAIHMPKESKRLIDRFPFDYIIGSVHSVRGIVDISFLDLDKMGNEELLMLWKDYISEMKELIDWGYFDTLAHITYPYRYLKLAGREKLLDLEKNGREIFEPILRAIIRKGISLEVNTSGLRQGVGQTLPGFDLIRFYRELGGELITVGSDAHHARDIGMDIRETIIKLKEIGFDHITGYKNREPYMEKITNIIY